MATKSYDVIIIGAGSIGMATAMYLGRQGLHVLVVEGASSIGQGSNKAAIGGVRATHSNQAKVYLSLSSIQELSNWESNYGDDIEWIQGGYSFVAYDQPTKNSLQAVVEKQAELNTGIQWLDQKELSQIIPSLSTKALLGGTFAPNDGSASPLKTINAFYVQAKEYAVDFRFNEKVVDVIAGNNKISGIVTTKETYSSQIIINAAGANAASIGKMIKVELPIRPNLHEAGVTEPVQRFLEPMVVDTRTIGQSSSIYFYQHATGQIIFCLTPDPSIWDKGTVETSFFLPLSARRLLDLIPSLKNLRVRRTWSGYYPMSPDGSPLLGWDRLHEGMLIAAGMCGQGFMLGPGIGILISRMIMKTLTDTDLAILKSLNPYRDFDTKEALK